MSDFIDRAKLEALADEHTREDTMVAWEKRYDDFMAGAAAYAVLLDAETTEEWGTWSPRFREFLPFSESRERAERHAAEAGEKIGVRRVAVTPGLPSEGGEKRG